MTPRAGDTPDVGDTLGAASTRQLVGFSLTAAGVTQVSAVQAVDGTISQLSSTVAEVPEPFLEDRWVACLEERLHDMTTRLEEAHVDSLVIELGDVVTALLARPADARLAKVWTLRVSPSANGHLAPMADWPNVLAKNVGAGWSHLHGGTDMFGNAPYEAGPAELDRVVEEARAAGAEVICISVAGALLDQTPEFTIAEHLVASCDLPVVLSHEVGGRRLIERENAAILNAALTRPVSPLLDVFARTVGSLCARGESYLDADGSLVGREDARALPLRLLGAGPAALAQGAAAEGGAETALILIWEGDQLFLMQIEAGVLRAEHFRTLGGEVRLGQRHAARANVLLDSSGRMSDHLARDLLQSDRKVVLVSASALDARSPERFEALAVDFARHTNDLVVVRDPPATLRALGAATARPQSEVTRFVLVDDVEDLQTHREHVRSLAVSRVLSAAREPTPHRATIDQTAPLSFLHAGPNLVRVHVIGTPPEVPP